MVNARLKTILIGLLILTFIAIFNSICFDGAKKSTAVFQSRGKSVEIDATITSSQKYTETDEGMDREYWHAMVSYEYDGITYEGVFYDRMDNKPPLGRVVVVKINPDNPGEVLPDNAEFILSLILSPVFLSVISVVLFFTLKWLINSLTNDKYKNSGFPKLIAIIIVLCKLIAESLIFYIQQDSLVFAAFSAIAVCSLALSLKFFKPVSKNACTQISQ